MTPSIYIERFVKGFEGLRLTAYKPTPDDVWTIGYGHTKGVKKGDTITVDEANQIFHDELRAFGAHVWDFVSAFPTTQNQFDAMVSLAYNIGIGNFSKSSVLRYHSQSNYQKAAASFLLWNKQKGKVLNGLVKRRAAEAALYSNTDTCPV